MRYLIDGYNLLHALGLAEKGPKGAARDRAGWEASRRKLLDWLAERLGDAARDATVVFDAQNSRGVPTASRHRDLTVVTAHGRTADDEIEERIRFDHQPHELTVVSSDHRLRDAARRASVTDMKCDAFIDFVMRPPKAATNLQGKESPEKDVAPSEAEQEMWLKAFGG
jgi:uncharacterized protein